MVDDDGMIRNSKKNVNKLRLIERELERLLGGTEFEGFTDAVLKVIRKRMDTIDIVMKNLGLTAGILGAQVYVLPEITYQIDLLLNSLTNKQEDVLTAMRDAFQRYYFDMEGGIQQQYETLYSDLIKKARVLPRYAKMGAHTTIGAVDQSLKREQADRVGIEGGRYEGPLDTLTRSYCRRTIGQWKT